MGAYIGAAQRGVASLAFSRIRQPDKNK